LFVGLLKLKVGHFANLARRVDKSGAASMQPIKYAKGSLESAVFGVLAAKDSPSRFLTRTLALADIFQGVLTSAASIGFI
jgi:hypothetical protein